MYVIILDRFYGLGPKRSICVSFYRDPATGEPATFERIAAASAVCDQLHEGEYILAPGETRRPAVKIAQCLEIGDVDLQAHVDILRNSGKAERAEL